MMAGLELIEYFHVIHIEFQGHGLQAVSDTFDFARAGDRQDVIALGQQPGKHDLIGGHVVFLRYLLNLSVRGKFGVIKMTTHRAVRDKYDPFFLAEIYYALFK